MDANALRVGTSLRSPRNLAMRCSTDSSAIAACKRSASRRGTILPSCSPKLRSNESTNYVGLARDSTDPSITRTTLVWLTRAQAHQEHELHWSGSQEPRLINNINYLGLARKNPDPSRAVCNRLFGFFPHSTH